MESTGVCAECLAADGSVKLPKSAGEIGHSVTITGSAMGSATAAQDSGIHKFYQCGKCGSVWMETREFGAGGHGRSICRLTASLF
jgi:hypothetical protein